MSEEKKEIKKYHFTKTALTIAESEVVPPDMITLVEESEYKKVVAENKMLDRILKQKVELIDQKNREIDQMSEEKSVVSGEAYDTLKAKYELCVRKLKKLGAYSQE